MAYYAPFYRPMGYYNPSVPTEMANIQGGQQFQQQQASMQQPVQQMPIAQSAPMPSNDMIWVLNETEATSFPVASNNSVTLWDKNQNTVYIKSVNMQGVPSMRILDYTERTADNAQKAPVKHECKCSKEFVSIDKFNELQNEFEVLRGELKELKEKPKAKNSKTIKEDGSDG